MPGSLEQSGTKKRYFGQADAAPSIVNFAQVDTDNDGTIDKKEFVAACGKGLVKFTDP
jgi:EF hand